VPADRRDCGVQRSLTSAKNEDMRAFGHACLGRRQADAGGATGEDGDLACK